MNQNTQKILNSFFLGLVAGIVACLLLPLMIKSYLDNNNIAQWSLNIFGTNLIEYNNPAFLDSWEGASVAWSVSSLIFVLSIPVTVLNTAVTVALTSLRKKSVL